MKLHSIPENSKIKCEVNDGSKFVTFFHIDGMYSYCETEKGGVIHLSASTPIKKVQDYYEII